MQSNILFGILRSRMMVDRSVAENVYLPWLVSVLNGSSAGLTLFKDKGELGCGAVDFETEAFAFGGDMPMQAMSQARAGSVAIVPVIGEFLKYGTDCSFGANEITPALYAAANNPNIIALVLDIDSGGGAESAVPMFLEAVKYVQSKGKPVVVHGDMVASAAYYVACHADYIMADNKISSAFGSVGVYVAWMDYREKLKKDGIKAEVVYAPQSTMKNQEFREVMENDNKEPLIENILKPSADRFIEAVRKGRKDKIRDDSDVYKGKLFDGNDIIKEGLADGWGNLQSAVKIAASMASIRK